MRLSELISLLQKMQAGCKGRDVECHLMIGHWGVMHEEPLQDVALGVEFDGTSDEGVPASVHLIYDETDEPQPGVVDA